MTAGTSMWPRRRRLAAAMLLGVAGVIATPGTAWAHGIKGSAVDLDAWEFIPLGIEHMLLGWDHLLFIAGVVLLAGEMRRAAQMISVFVAGHSTTLIIATAVGWHVSAAAVDVVIALSLVFVGIVGIVGWFGHRDRWRLFGFAVLGFGLIHGLGLSARLQDLGLPEDGLLARVILFNIGIEIGQLLGIAVLLVIGRLIARFVRSPKAPRVAYAGLVVVGLVAAVALSVIAATEEDPITAIGQCTVGPRTQPFPREGGHPAKDFFEPAEASPRDDFGHVLGDGYVIVQYQPTLAPTVLDQLRKYVTSPEGTRVVGGPAPDQKQPIRAINAFEMLTCPAFDLAALRQFTNTWYADPRSQ
ncbi:HupE/UreJ family protein [Streptosporangium longisporum]|uniref:Uncharacterized protein n=1 Tax=Streptosporangium longisporum TaxID=46187 RepID=A0ABN3Y3E6_9ACTN